MWGVIIHPFPNFNDGLVVEIMTRVSTYIPLFTR